MADPTALNGQITDSVTQANVKVLAEAPAQALASVYQASAQVNGIDMQHAVAAQQQMNTISEAVTTQGTNAVLTMDTAAIGRATLAIMTGNSTATQLAQLLASVATGSNLIQASRGRSSRRSQPGSSSASTEGSGVATGPITSG